MEGIMDILGKMAMLLGYVGESESARDDLQRAIQLRNAFSAALADIRDSWSKKDADNKN